ncbi:MAG: Gfo/Idh/MocA family oxidoreductase [Burkholderiaceae bacterium]
MIEREQLDAVVVSTPSRLHAAQVGKALTAACTRLARSRSCSGRRRAAAGRRRAAGQRVTQVGYHHCFVGAFRRPLGSCAFPGVLGKVHHVCGEAYGPVVLRARGGTWRSSKNEGGGALYDYACHAIDAMNFLVGSPGSVGGAAPRRVLARRGGRDLLHAALRRWHERPAMVNWSDESLRKMSTRISVWGTNGRVNVDRQECQVYLREAHPARPDLPAGWSVRYTTDLDFEPVWFYLRGEEYWHRSRLLRPEHSVAAPTARTVSARRAGDRQGGGDDSRPRTHPRRLHCVRTAHRDQTSAREDSGRGCGAAPERATARLQERYGMDRVLFGDNQFFGINHMSEEKARAQQMRFQDLQAVIDVSMPLSRGHTDHARRTTAAQICDHVRANPGRYPDYQFDIRACRMRTSMRTRSPSTA